MGSLSCSSLIVIIIICGEIVFFSIQTICTKDDFSHFLFVCLSVFKIEDGVESFLVLPSGRILRKNVFLARNECEKT